MGCKQSKAAVETHPPVGGGKPGKSHAVPPSAVESSAGGAVSSSSFDPSVISNTISASKPERLYQILYKAQMIGELNDREHLLHKAIEHLQQEPKAASYQHPTTQFTPLHLAVRLMDSESGKTETLFQVIRVLLSIYPQAMVTYDRNGNIPLHYAVAPASSTTQVSGPSLKTTDSKSTPQEMETQSHVQQTDAAAAEDLQHWKTRASILEYIVAQDPVTAREYLSQNNIVFHDGTTNSTDDVTTMQGGCTPLYRVLQTIPDDFDTMGPTVEYTAVVQSAYSKTVGVGNADDGDKPLALLYRRFTRQFDISEKFFAGDNSRLEVVNHRKRYKTAAGNTWKIIELLLRPDSDETHWGIVHRAVQVETPPDLLRYIVETNAQDLTRVDKEGNLPLHHAAKSKPPTRVRPRAEEGTNGSGGETPTVEDKTRQFPAFYTKYVVDELLYKFPEGASMPDADGNYSLTLAIQSGKQWIGGGIKSLYDAYPDALKQIDLKDHQSLQRALSMGNDDGRGNDDDDDDGDDEPTEKAPDYPAEMDGIIKDEHHDAIMLVQQPNVDISEVATSMWAHEEDAGVQMLGCVAIARMAEKSSKSSKEVLRIALAAVAAVVNAMKAHPNEMIVQEKACHALKHLAKADGHREVSMVASGAVAAIVGAMQAHVGDPGVQEEACAAVAAIVTEGGSDRATVVASVSGVTAIINAIAAHPSVAGVQLYGCCALKALTEFPNANIPELPKQNTEPLLTAAKKQFPECTEAADIVLSRMTS